MCICVCVCVCNEHVIGNGFWDTQHPWPATVPLPSVEEFRGCVLGHVLYNKELVHILREDILKLHILTAHCSEASWSY